jgi:hypothetical protein
VTVAEHQFGGIDHAIDFSHYDALIARADKVLRSDRDAFYTEHGAQFSIASCVDALRGAVATAERWRKVPRPGGAAK